MRISQLSRYTFKVTLTRQDVKRMDPEFDVSDKQSYTGVFISSLIDIIEKSMNAKITRSKLFVEVFEDTSGGCVVYICSNEAFSKSDVEKLNPGHEIVFSLNFKMLCALAKALKKAKIEAFSSLYYLSDYRLVLKIKKADEQCKALSRLISIYHASSQTSDILFTAEHYKLLCGENAVEKILSVV